MNAKRKTTSKYLDDLPTKFSIKSNIDKNLNAETVDSDPRNTSVENSSIDNFNEKLLNYPCTHPSYNPNRKPSDYEKAKLYADAHKLTNLDYAINIELLDEFSGLRSSSHRLPLLSSLDKLAPYGPVLPMFFSLMKQFLLLTFILSGLAIFIMLEFNGGATTYVQFINILESNEEGVLFLVSSTFGVGIFFILFSYYIRLRLKKIKLAAKKKAVCPSDYTLMISDLGKGYTTDELKYFFTSKLIPNFNLELQNIVLTYDIREIITELRNLNHAIEEKSKADFDGRSRDSRKYENLIQSINLKLNKNAAKLKDYSMIKLSGTSFMVYNSKQEAKSLRRKFEFSAIEKYSIWLIEKCTGEFPEYFFKENMFKVEKAPELNEVMWENLGNKSKFCSSFMLFVLVGIEIAISVALMYYSKNLIQGILTSDQNWFGEDDTWLVSVIYGLIIYIMNLIVEKTIISITLREKLFSVTSYYRLLTTRLSFYLALSTITPMFVLYVVLIKENIQALSNSLLLISIIVFFLPIIIKYISSLDLITSFRRARARSNLNNIHQDQLNRTFLDPELNIAKYFGFICQILLTTFSLYPSSPAIAFCGFLAIFMNYWIDKYLILNKHMIPTNLRSEIAEDVINMIDFAILLLSIGNFLAFMNHKANLDLNSDSYGTSLSSAIFGMILALVFFLLPNQRIARSCSKKRNAINAFTQPLLYQQVKEYFYEEYQDRNPVLKDQKVSFEFLENYKDTLKKFKGSDILQETPEIITLFEYAMLKPSYYTSCTDPRYYGPHNPYFVYPQNYRYAGNTFNDLTLPMMDRNECEAYLNSSMSRKSSRAISMKKSPSKSNNYDINLQKADTDLEKPIYPVPQTMNTQNTLMNELLMLQGMNKNSKADSGSYESGIGTFLDGKTLHTPTIGTLPGFSSMKGLSPIN